MATSPESASSAAPGLRRVLTLGNLVLIGLIIVQPTAPMGICGVISNKAPGQVAATILAANFASGMGAQLAAGRLLYGMGRGAMRCPGDFSAP